MADTFASFAAKVDKFGKAMSDDALGHSLGKMANTESGKAFKADLGPDGKFSGWAAVPKTRYDILGPGRVSFRPAGARAAGPITVAESGRNQAAGPAIGSKGRRGSRKRWNGRTQGKGTATDAVTAIEREAPKIVQRQVADAIRKTF